MTMLKRNDLLRELPPRQAALDGRKPFDEENAVEVVVLVLDRDGEEPLRLEALLLPLAVLVVDGDRRFALHLFAEPRHRQAALLEDHLPLAVRQARVDELEELARPFVLHAQIDDERADAPVYLRRREADAARRVHGLRHLVEQL